MLAIQSTDNHPTHTHLRGELIQHAAVWFGMHASNDLKCQTNLFSSNVRGTELMRSQNVKLSRDRNRDKVRNESDNDTRNTIQCNTSTSIRPFKNRRTHTIVARVLHFTSHNGKIETETENWVGVQHSIASIPWMRNVHTIPILRILPRKILLRIDR